MFEWIDVDIGVFEWVDVDIRVFEWIDVDIGGLMLIFTILN